MKNIFPKEIIEFTTQAHHFKHNKKSLVIYTLILTTFISAFISLPFIKVDVYSTSRGIIKSEKEHVKLSSLYSSKVLRNNIEINKQVLKGDTLLVMDDYAIDGKLNLIKISLTQTNEFIHDANYLLNDKHINLDSIYTEKYRKEYIKYKEKLLELQTRYQKSKRDYLRTKRLFEKGVIASVEYENSKFEYDLNLNSIAQCKKQQFNQWQADLTSKRNEFNELENSFNLSTKDKNYYILTAPVSGTLMNVIGIEEGSFISAGIPLAEISPDSDLIAECHVSPIDIGLIKPNTDVSFQIDAFNYNQWGLANGKIVEIGQDIELINEVPIFKIRCKLNQKYLTLKSNFKGNLKKGMTLNARFKLTERTLAQLLYDKVDDWLNPSNRIAKDQQR